MLSRIHPLFFVILVFTISRLLFIFSYPPFNDESIHLAWARVMVAKKEARFISMVWGGKQPLPFWLWGLAQTILPKYPFTAGRLVSTVFSFIALFGIYKLTRHLSDRKAAIFASLSYAINPMLVFFSSQVLMEIMIFAVAVWLFYSLLKIVHLEDVLAWTPRKTMQLNRLWLLSIAVGQLLGLGFWVKSTMVIFMGLATFTLLVQLGGILAWTPMKKTARLSLLPSNQDGLSLLFKRATISQLILTVASLVLVSLTTVIILLPLITHPSWTSFASWNARYGLSLGELMQFPLKNWWNNLRLGTIWYLYYLTPTFLLISLWQLTTLFPFQKQKRLTKRTGFAQKIDQSFLLLFWFVISSLATVSLIRNASSRHFVPATFPLFILFGIGVSTFLKRWRFLPTKKRENLGQTKRSYLVLPLRSAWSPLTWFHLTRVGRNKIFQTTLLSVAFVPQIILTLLLVTNPPAFFSLLGRLTPFAKEGYLVAGWESGYGVPQAITFIKKESQKQKIVVLVRQDDGNPEDAIIAAFWDDPRVVVTKIPWREKGQSELLLEELKTINSPIYFVSRGRQYAGLDKYLTQIARFDKPWGEEFIGVYRLR